MLFNVRNIATYIKETSEQIPEELPYYISKYFSGGIKNYNKGFSNIAPSNSKKIGDVSGDLYRSFTPRDKNNITNINNNNGTITIDYGSKIKYASVHETGMFVRSKGNMHKFFWAKYFETKNPYMKNMALSIKKRGGVNIPKREYFNPALRDFEREGLPILLNDLLNKIASDVNG